MGASASSSSKHDGGNHNHRHETKKTTKATTKKPPSTSNSKSPTTKKPPSKSHSSLFQKATVTQHTINNNTSSTSTTQQKNIWDYYDKIENIAQGSTCEIFTVSRKTDDKQQEQPTYIAKEMIKDRVSQVVLQEMQSEIELLQTLDHPNVVRIYETFQDSQTFYLVMEHLQGGDLYSRDQYTEPQVAKIMTQLCSALVYCHENDVVHRDIKMENIMFDNKDANSDITLIDFGLSTRYIKSPGHDKLADKVGTMYSMSPQVLEGAYTEKADMWAVGVVAFILLSGKRPFDATDDKALAKIIHKGEYSMDGSEWHTVSKDAKSFVQKLLQYTPSERLSAKAALRTPFLQKTYSLAERRPSATSLHRIQRALVDSRKDSNLQKFAMMVVAYRMPVGDIVELRAAFDAFDQNNHGTINYWEFKQALQSYSSNDDDESKNKNKISENDMRRLFQELDRNQTGVINYSEFLAATLDTRMLVERDLIRSAFDKLDLDQSGYIYHKELEELLGDDFDAQTLQEVFDQLDEDGDGRISYAEFLKLFDNRNASAVEDAKKKVE